MAQQFIAPDVAPEPVRPPRMQPTATVESFGGGPGLEAIGQEQQRLAIEGGDVAAFEKIRQDQTAVQDAADKLAQVHADILYHPETGVLASEGANALQAHQDGWKRYRDAANDIAGSLKGEAQQGAFHKIALAMGDSFQRTAMVHVDQQLKQHDTDTFNSLVKNLTDNAAMAYGDPMHGKLMLGMIHDAADSFAQRKGMGPEEKTGLMGKIDSHYHEAVIARMLGDKQDVNASAYYEANKANISDPEINEHMARAVEEGSYRGKSQRAADAIWAKTNGNLSDAFAQADREKDPEVRDRIHQRLREKDSEVKDARISDQDNAYFDATKIVDNNFKSGNKAAGEQSLTDQIGPALWTRMSVNQQEALKRRSFNDQNSDKAWTEYSLMSPTDKAGQSQSDFEADILTRLDKNHRDKAIAMRNAAMGNHLTALSDHEQAQLIQNTAQQTGVIPGLRPGIPASKLRGDAAVAYGNFNDRVQGSISDFERNELGGRRRASQQETQKIIDQQVLKEMENQKTPFFTSVGRLVGLSAKPQVPFTDIPDPDKQDILEAARKMGKAVTKEQIERAYQFKKSGDLKAAMRVLQ